MKQRFIAILLCLCLLFTLLPVTALAEGEQDSGAAIGTSGLCEHHAAHDESCGYTEGSTEGTEETPCAHEHAEDCYTLVAECVHIHTAECYPADSVSGNEATPSDAAEPICAHECSAESGCITEVLDCKHEHDGGCGYAPAAEGTPCGFICGICGGEAEEAEPETKCICTGPCTEGSVNEDCPVCGAEGADLTACEGVEAQPAALSVMALAAENTPSTLIVGNITVDLTNGGYWTTDNDGKLTSSDENNYNVHYDAANNTLTLKGATIKGSYDPTYNQSGAGIYATSASGQAVSLTINLEDTNEVSGSTGIFVYSPNNGGEASLTIKGSGSLTATGSQHGIKVQSNNNDATLSIQAVKIETKGGNYTNEAGVCLQAGNSASSNASLTVDGGSLTASGDLGIQYSFGVDAVTGTPSLTVSGNALVDARDGGIRAGDSSSAEQVTPTGSNGIVFDGNNGTVYGNMTLQEDLTIGAGETLNIPDGASLNTGGHNLIVDGGTLDGTVTGNVTIKVTKVTLDQTSLTLDVGGAATLTATVEPDNATDKTVKWESDNTSVATVENGVVTAVGGGTATITATADGKSATCSVTVNEATHSHSWGAWQSNGNGTHTRTCAGDSSHTENGNCSGGTATCQSPTICSGCGQPYGSALGHDWGGWTSVDNTGHKRTCSRDNTHVETANHTPGGAATETTAQTCTVCGYVIAPALGHTHTWGAWQSNGNGTHTRTCSGDSSHIETLACSGGTATCKDKAICSVCNTAYGSLNSSNHTGGTETRGYVAATATTAGYTGDTYCLGCNTKIATGTTIPKTGGGGGNRPSYDDDNDDEDTPVPPAPTTPANQPTTTDSGGWPEIKDEIRNTPPGGTVHVDMNGATVVPGEIWNEIAGKDIAVEFDMGGGLTWTVNGKDIPTGGNLSDLNLGISTTANTIPVDIINNITGERYTVQLTLSHNGEFGFRLYLIVDVGLESAGYWANLYHYNTGRNSLDFMAAERIDSKGKAALPFDHASSYAVVIDTESHAPTSPATGDTEYITYTVQKGDTLWAISRKYGCTVSDIVAANSSLIKDPDLIYAGWQLTIPQAGATGTDTTPDAILPDDKKTGVYIVKRGDTLWAISRKYGCTVAEIIALNGELITDPDLILVGWELLIPQD